MDFPELVFTKGLKLKLLKLKQFWRIIIFVFRATIAILIFILMASSSKFKWCNFHPNLITFDEITTYEVFEFKPSLS